MSEAKKCPKCGGEMVKGYRLVGEYGLRSVNFAKEGDVFGDNITPFYCKNCGYIELYKEIKRRNKP